MLELIKVSPKYKKILTHWFKNDKEGQSRVGFYQNFNSWFKLLDFKSRFGWLALMKNKPVGFTDLEMKNKTEAYFSFYIAPEFRGKGLGRDLLRTIIARARHMGLTKIMGTSEVDNSTSQKSLLAMGFSHDGTDQDGFVVYILEL